MRTSAVMLALALVADASIGVAASQTPPHDPHVFAIARRVAPKDLAPADRLEGACDTALLMADDR
jgi:hypothetical protein